MPTRCGNCWRRRGRRWRGGIEPGEAVRPGRAFLPGRGRTGRNARATLGTPCQAASSRLSLRRREQLKRLEELLEKQDRMAIGAEALRVLRAIEVLEQIGTPEAQNVLKTLAEGAPEVRRTREAKAACERLAKRSRALP